MHSTERRGACLLHILQGTIRRRLWPKVCKCWIYSKTCLKWPLKKNTKLVFNNNYRFMQVKSIAECSKGSILHYFWPSLIYHLSLRPLFCLFLSGCLRKVLLYSQQKYLDWVLMTPSRWDFFIEHHNNLAGSLSSFKWSCTPNVWSKSKWAWSGNATITHNRPTHGTVDRAHQRSQ